MKKITALLFLAISTYAVAQPTISSLTPASGHPGATVTISGTGFNTTAANNIVYFGATRATVTSASSASLVVQVPAGATYMPVSVNNTATSLAAFSEYPFLPTYDHSAYVAGATDFDVRQNFTSIPGAAPIQTAIQDIDGDGKADLVVLTNVDISVYLNTSTTGSITSSSFAPPVSIPLPGAITIYYCTAWQFSGSRGLLAITDIDGDGKQDIVYTLADNNIYLMRNMSTVGSVNFSTSVSFVSNGGPADNQVFGVAIGDLDGDGKPDIISCNSGGSISVFHNVCVAGSLTSTSLAAPLNIPIGPSGYSANIAAVGDLDNDGKPDVVVTTLSDSISVFKNTSAAGAISFSSPVGFATLAPDGPDNTVFLYGTIPGQSAGAVITDIDGDSKPDLAVTNNWSNTISVFRNTSATGTIDASSFGVPVIFQSAFQASAIVAGDFDGDGKPDLAVSGGSPKVTFQYFYDELLYIYRNTSTPGTIDNNSFATMVRVNGHSNMLSIAAGDLDGDGKPDLVSANTNDSNITVLFNAPKAPVTVASVTPLLGVPGSTVTITGTNFNPTPANDIVYFGAARATVATASSTSLIVSVPPGATYERVSVSNSATNTSSYFDHDFLPSFNDPTYGPSVKFEKYVEFDDPVRARNKTAVLMDIDGDGKADVVAITDSGFTVYRNTSTVGSITSSSFATPVDFPATLPNYIACASGDIDGDGKPDVIIAAGEQGVIVFRNTSTTGTISFDAPVSFAFNPACAGNLTIAIADLNGDGKPDIITGDKNVGVSIYWNTATAGSIASNSLTTSESYDIDGGLAWTSSIAVADIDGDGRPDIVAATGDTVVLVFHGTLEGFDFPVSFVVGNYCNNISVADIDGDGKPDIIGVNSPDSTVSILRNVATPGIVDATSFASQVIFHTGYEPQSVAVADFDGDGKPDIVVSSLDTSALRGQVSIFRNTATPGIINSSSFATRVDSAAGFAFYSVAGDIDGDGKADIIGCSWGDDTTNPGIVVLRNDPLPPTTHLGNNGGSTPKMKVTPNPNNGSFNLAGNTGTNENEVLNLQVTDVLGQVIYNSKTIAKNGVINEKVVLYNTLANGMYLLNVTTATGNSVFHFVVEK